MSGLELFYKCVQCALEFIMLDGSLHCATSRKVAGSVPEGVIGIFH